MRKLSILLATAATIAAVPASAQDTTAVFTGPYVGAIVGYDITKAGSSVDNDADEDDDQSIDGFMYGAAVGYDFDFGGFVVGAEAEISTSTADTEYDSGDFEGFGLGNVSTNRDLYLGARIGKVVGSNMLIYVKGGYTNAKFDVRSTDGETELQQDVDADGWRLGAGLEYAMPIGGMSKTYARLEYRYSNYQRAELDFGGDIPDTDRFDIDLDRHQIVASLGVRF